jgi:hypothetical protein
VFTTQYQIGQVSTLDVSFTGKDDRWWAGYYGPAVKGIDVRLMYGVNPCATNPAYSSECAGFSNVLTSTNLSPNPNGYAVYGNSLNQSFAINQALGLSGSGVQIHGFQWGYVANANGPYCNFWLIDCWDYRVPKVTTNVGITDSSGATLYSNTREYTNSYNTTRYSHIFPASRNLATLGNFNFTATTNDQAYVGGVWTTALYTPDPCADPLSSPSCPGYGAAYAAKYATTAAAATTSSYTSPIAATSATSVAAADPTQSEVTSTNVGGVELSTSGTISTPDGVPQVVKESQPAATSSSSSGGGSKPSSLVMNAIKAVQEQNKATEQRAVANAQTAVSASVAQSQETATAAIANMAVIAVASVQQPAQSSMQQSSGALNLMQNASLQQQTVGAFSLMQNAPSQQQQAMGVLSLNLNRNSSQSITMSTASVGSAASQGSVESPYRYEAKATDSDAQPMVQQMTNGSRTDPLSNMMQQNNLSQQTAFEQRSDSVNKNVQPNELAGGVDIASMALSPSGFSSYSFTLTDAAFYTPKEIYRNQRVTDNVRALRQMSSDGLHQRMVNGQYKQEVGK